MQALLILFGALFTAACCVACGRLLLRDAVADTGIHFVAGAAALSAAVFVLAVAGLVYAPVFLVLGLAVLWMAWRRGGKSSKPQGKGSRVFACLFCVLFIAYLVVYLCHAMAPEISPDGTSYHLGLVSRYLREHGFHRITTNMYASLSQGVEMLFLFAFAFGKHSAAALVHLTFLLALVWQIFTYSRHAGFAAAGACAAFLVFASPVVGIDATSAYNDVAVAAIAFTVFHLLEAWDESRRDRLLLAIGLVAGFAYAVKYTAALAVPYAVGYVAWKSRRWRDAATVAVCAALLIIPWMLKNWLWVENPFAPFFNNWFLNPYVSISFENEYRQYLTRYELASLWQIPMQITTYGSLSGLVGPVFLLSPLALLSLARREGRHLLLAALVFGSTYFMNIGARFLIPPLPFVALAMMLVIARLPALPWVVVLVHAYLSWPSIVPKYGKQDPWRLARMPWREALRIRSEDAYLERWVPGYGITRLIEDRTPPGATVLTFEPLPEAYTSRNILVVYQATENRMSGGIFWLGALPDYAPTMRLRFPFPRQKVQALRVVQTNTGNDLWSLNEFRVFDGTSELPRESRWRLRARPYPWEIQNAFDNSLVTFWMSGETLHPGMYVQVDFGAQEAADSVEIETAPNQWQAKLQLEGQSAAGDWKLLAASPEQSEEARPVGLRRAAAAELKRRGIDFVLLFDEDVGADDLRRNAARWGVREVAESGGARLYQLP